MMNFKIFQKLCGESTLRNAVIVTNMWGEVDLQVGEAREVELMRGDTFFKPVIDKGVQIARNGNTITSAQNIIRLVLDNHPLPLRIQEELVDERKNISETSASEALNREINAQIKEHREEMRVLKEMCVLKEEVCVLKEEMRAMRRENEEMQAMKRENEEEMRAMGRENEEEMRVMRRENEEEMRAMRRENEETKKELQKMQRETETR